MKVNGQQWSILIISRISKGERDNTRVYCSTRKTRKKNWIIEARREMVHKGGNDQLFQLQLNLKHGKDRVMISAKTQYGTIVTLIEHSQRCRDGSGRLAWTKKGTRRPQTVHVYQKWNAQQPGYKQNIEAKRTLNLFLIYSFELYFLPFLLLLLSLKQ